MLHLEKFGSRPTRRRWLGTRAYVLAYQIKRTVEPARMFRPRSASRREGPCALAKSGHLPAGEYNEEYRTGDCAGTADAGRDSSVEIDKFDGRRPHSSTELPFDINASDGRLTLARQLDYEVQSEFSLSFLCTDTLGLTATGAVRIMVHDVNEAPVGVVASWLVPEHAHPGATIANVSARDQDQHDHRDGALAFGVVSTGGARLSALSSVQHPNSTSLAAALRPPRAG